MAATLTLAKPNQDVLTTFEKPLTPVKRSLEPVGKHFLAHARRTLRGRTWSEDEQIEAVKNVKNVEDNGEEDEEEEEPEDPEMLQRDAKDWRHQDHYAVLGLSKYRYKATEEQIRKAHRRKVLKHHPDKKAAQGHTTDQDSFFKCIQKAFEVLLDPVKRRQFDSVDEGADVAPPSKKTKGDFFELWGPVFESEARFSKQQPMPQLGDMNSPRQQVDNFYNSWYHFDSWRTFEYLDEESPDDTDNRDHKRYVEKKNKTARQKRKNEDVARLTRLVDEALASDPRIKKFREEEKKAKEQRKWDRESGARKAAEEAKKAAEEAKAKKEQEERKAKEDREKNKKLKESAKNARKKNKRVIKASAQEANYFVPQGTDPDQDTKDFAMADIDLLSGTFDDVQLADAAQKLSELASGSEKPASIVDFWKQIANNIVSDGKLPAADLRVLQL